jgi:polyhydroxybutyrate depolymerase
VAVTVALAVLVATGTRAVVAADADRRVNVAGSTRTYRVHLPPSYDGVRAFPVVLVFHGGASDADTMVQFSGLNEKADRAGFIAVYPNGSGRLGSVLTWNAGECCGFAIRNRVDDVAFTRRMIDDLVSTYRVDERRIFATGMSNGAMMAHRLGAELADRIAAIAPVSGPLGTASIRPARPVAVMHFHGTDDEHAPYDGGQGSRSLTATRFRSVNETIRLWVNANGCSTDGAVTHEPNTADDRMTVTRTAYSGCRQNADVVLFTIVGGGHTWPGLQPSRRAALLRLGPATRDISANDLMWEFFERHPLEAPAFR